MCVHCAGNKVAFGHPCLDQFNGEAGWTNKLVASLAAPILVKLETWMKDIRASNGLTRLIDATSTSCFMELYLSPTFLRANYTSKHIHLIHKVRYYLMDFFLRNSFTMCIVDNLFLMEVMPNKLWPGERTTRGF